MDKVGEKVWIIKLIKLSHRLFYYDCYIRVFWHIPYSLNFLRVKIFEVQ